MRCILTLHMCSERRGYSDSSNCQVHTACASRSARFTHMMMTVVWYLGLFIWELKKDSRKKPNSGEHAYAYKMSIYVYINTLLRRTKSCPAYVCVHLLIWTMYVFTLHKAKVLRSPWVSANNHLIKRVQFWKHLWRVGYTTKLSFMLHTRIKSIYVMIGT